MQENVYAVPESSLEISQVPVRQMFYVVSKTKFWVLFIFTFGYYSIYWHFKNWKQFKDYHNEKMMPAMRGIFSIFFTHTLFREVDSELKKRSKEFYWSPGLWATLAVVAVIAARIIDRLYVNDLIGSFAFASVFIFVALNGFSLSKAQLAINESCDDPLGSANRKFTILNWIWITLGGLGSLVVLAGLIIIGLEQGII